MKKIIILSLILSFFVYSEETTNSKEPYKDGTRFGNGLKPNLNDIKNFDMSQLIEGGVNSNPEQTKYYNGVNKTDGNLIMSDGMNQFNHSEFKQPIIDSMNKKPALTKENQLISDSLTMQNGILKDPNGNFCIKTIARDVATDVRRSCLQDSVEYGQCLLKPNVTWKEEETSLEEITETTPLYLIPEMSDKNKVYFKFKPTYDGKLIKATINYHNDTIMNAAGIVQYIDNKGHVVMTYTKSYPLTSGFEYHRYNVFNKEYTQYFHLYGNTAAEHFEQYRRAYSFEIGGYSNDIANYQDVFGEQIMTIELTNKQYKTRKGKNNILMPNNNFAKDFMCEKGFCRRVSLTYTMLVKKRHQSPVIAWHRECDFNFKDNDIKVNVNNDNLIPATSANYKLTKNECTINNTDRMFVDEVGNVHNIHFPCYEYNETYEKKTDINPSCAMLDNDKTCIKDKRVCTLYDHKNNCTQYSIEYSCQTNQQKDGYQCGNLFYTNCETEECNGIHKNANFGDVVSKLQTITEAAQNINEDPNNIKIFTGKALHCRTAFGGYNNCCKEGGWGQDLGLAGCNNQEKELAGAKRKGLAISVGEYCSKKVLGVCMQKKRSYCTFNSKLAKIVQQQGRNSQLRIGFGDKKHPDCRGMSLEEFERINFDIINFSEFYNDLNQQVDIPSEQAIKNRVQK